MSAIGDKTFPTKFFANQSYAPGSSLRTQFRLDSLKMLPKWRSKKVSEGALPTTTAKKPRQR
jgi:hypothetical protein